MMDNLTNSVEELYTLYHKDIVRFFAEHLADREGAWDLCHEVFVRLLLALASGTQLAHPQRRLFHSTHARWRYLPAMRQRSGPCLNAKTCCMSSWRPCAPCLRNTGGCSSGVKSSGCPCRRSLCVLEQQKLCSPPSYGGHASSCRKSTSDGGSRSFFPPMKRYLSTSMT